MALLAPTEIEHKPAATETELKARYNLTEAVYEIPNDHPQRMKVLKHIMKRCESHLREYDNMKAGKLVIPVPRAKSVTADNQWFRRIHSMARDNESVAHIYQSFAKAALPPVRVKAFIRSLIMETQRIAFKDDTPSPPTSPVPEAKSSSPPLKAPVRSASPEF